MIVRLRTLTLKSIIGFGKYQDLSVQNLIDLGKEIDLIQIYYRLGAIDFNEEVKKLLFITPDREINKPGKDYEKYRSFVREIIDDITDYKVKHGTCGMSKKIAMSDKKRQSKDNDITFNRYISKGMNKARNDKNYSPFKK